MDTFIELPIDECKENKKQVMFDQFGFDSQTTIVT